MLTDYRSKRSIAACAMPAPFSSSNHGEGGTTLPQRRVQGFGIRRPDVAALAGFALPMLVTYVPDVSKGLVELFYR